MIYKYDGTHEKCPVPLVNLRLILKKMQSGDLCIITIKDVGSINDIPKLLRKQGYDYDEQVIDDGSVELSINACRSCSKVN